MSKLRFRDYFRIHIDISSIVIILLVILIGYRSVANYLFHWVDWISKEIKWPTWFGEFSLNFFSDVISAIVLIYLGYLILGWKKKPYFAGKFKAFEIVKDKKGNETETEWGILILSYNIFLSRLKGVLKSKDGTVCIELNGSFDKERYFRGTYIEKDKPSRLRLGAFLMLLDANGDNYKGSFMHVSPTTAIDEPELGFARWEKITC